MVDNGFNDDQTQSFVPLTAGTQVSHYKIITKIGAGGMGEVYLAEDSKLARNVALKFLPSYLCQNQDARNRFIREAKATAKLDHPNIISIYEVDEFQNRPFFAMAHIEGKTLRQVIKEGNLSVNQAVDYTMQICEGLHKAHGSGIVHRDMKPGNIIIDKDDKVRILDFGLATVQGEEQLTKTGSTLGTVGYMSPEQIKGQKIDQRSDLFSVGVILYEMLTGKRPFEGDNDTAVSYSITNTTPEPIARFKSGTTGELQQIIDKALTKDPALRYQNVDGLLVDLKRINQSGQGEQKNNKHTLSIIVILILLITVFLLLSLWTTKDSMDETSLTEKNLLAVMYFDNLVEPTDSLRLGEIATNLLITDLSESEFIRIVSSQRLHDILKSIGQEETKRIDRSLASEIAKKAGSKWMLLGSILQVEPSIILTSQLVDVKTGSAIASQRINGNDEDNIFSMIDKLTIEIKKDLSLPEEALNEIDVQMSGYTESAEAYKHYLEGWEQLYRYNRVEAVSKFQMALNLDSTFCLAYFGLTWATPDLEIQHNAINKALLYVDDLNETDRLSLLARKAQLDDDNITAIENLKKLLIKTPDDKDSWNWLGVLYKSVDKSKAVESFRKAIEIDSTYKLAYNELAYVYNSLGDLDKSIWAINKYIEIAPNEPNPFDTRGYLYALNGKLDKAVASFEKALEIDPSFVVTKQRLADIYMFNEQYDKAVTLYKELTSHSDKHQRAYGRLLLARIPAHQGQFNEALRLLKFGIESDILELGEGSSVASKLWVHSILEATELGNIEEGINNATKAITIVNKINPRESFILHIQAMLTRFYSIKGDYAKAEQTTEKMHQMILQNETENFSNYNLAKAFIAFEKGDYGSFADIWKIPDNSRFFAANYFIGLDYFLAGRIGEAVHTFEQIINTYDSNRAAWPSLSVKAHYWLGRAYEASGWNKKAVEQYEKFLHIWRNADKELKIVEDAKGRLAQLKKTT